MERLERLFAFLESKGVTSVELFGHAGFPADTDVAGWPRTARCSTGTTSTPAAGTAR